MGMMMTIIMIYDEYGYTANIRSYYVLSCPQ